jgi:hypothetical protein
MYRGCSHERASRAVRNSVKKRTTSQSFFLRLATGSRRDGVEPAPHKRRAVPAVAKKGHLRTSDWRHRVLYLIQRKVISRHHAVLSRLDCFSTANGRLVMFATLASGFGRSGRFGVKRGQRRIPRFERLETRVLPSVVNGTIDQEYGRTPLNFEANRRHSGKLNCNNRELN